MKNKKSELVMEYFNEILPDAKCELNYNHDYELLIAVMLSAQTTDKKVNACTEILFKQYPTIDSLANASLSDIETILHPLGLYKNKAKNVIAIAKKLQDEFNGLLPHERERLTAFPGVGRKTANVTRIELFNEQEFPVDTHIDRISKRLGFASTQDDVLVVEEKLKKAFPKEKYALLHHQFIHFGREICSAKSPKCLQCKLVTICKYKSKTI